MPSLTEYSAAIQNPQNCFKNNNRLTAAKPNLDSQGLPVVASGNFAVVYQLELGSKKYAVRCFTRLVTDQRRRYELLNKYLQELSLPALVEFEYQEDGILVQGRPYPIVLMEWINGDVLHRYIERQLRNPDKLSRLAAQWRGIVASLWGARLAHGDLQHGNILVSSSGIRLVDYDGFYLPALQNNPPGEAGHPNYQHPHRIRSGYYRLNMDTFSALVIYVSLLALKADPSLWQFHAGENLIFVERDYKQPGRTEVWRRLKNSADAKVKDLAAILEHYCHKGIDSLSYLEDAINDRLQSRDSSYPEITHVECPKCRHVNQTDEIYCQRCGHQLCGDRKCPHCSRNTPVLSKFCVHCSRQL